MKQERHPKDSRTGARVSFRTMVYGANRDRVLHRGFIRRGGREWILSAKTREACEGKVAAKLAELEAEGVSAAELSAEQKHDAARARKLLADGETLEAAAKELQIVRDVLGTGRALADALEDIQRARAALGGRVPLAGAADYWVLRHPGAEAVTLGEARNAYVRKLEEAGKNGNYQRTVEARLAALVAALGEKTPLVSIGREDVEAMLAEWKHKAENGLHVRRGKGGRQEGVAAYKFSNATWNAWVVTFGGFFNWAVRKYHLRENPLAGIERKESKRGKVDFLAVDEVEALLRASERVAPEYAPALAVLFFAGLRPTEVTGQYAADGSGVIGGLTWEDTDFDGELFVAATKDGNSRQVPISDNLRAWLDAYGGGKKGRLVPNPQAWKKARKAIVEAAGVAWPQDFARHSFATYHFALHKDRAAVEAAMGHSFDSKVLEKHYKRPARKSEAEKFWSIMPTKKGE